MTPSDGRWHLLPSVPVDATCIGSTDDWIALRHDHADGHNYLLYNPFSKASIPLELDAVVAKATGVRKVLVRSTAAGDLIVAILTNNTRRPFILSCGGKDVWLPGRWDLLYSFIIDIAFLEDKLYAITQDENLFPIDICLDGDGKLMVADGRRVVRQPISYYGYNKWSASEDEDEAAGAYGEEADVTSDDDDDDEVAGTLDEAGTSNKEAIGTSYEDGDEEIAGASGEKATMTSYEDDDEEVDRTSDEEAAETYEDEAGGASNEEVAGALYDDVDEEWESVAAYEEDDDEPCEEDDNTIPDGFDFVDEDAPHGSKVRAVIVRYLVESRGKLLMVKQYVQLSTPIGLPAHFTRQVEVFEASAGAWVPMTNGLGGGQALFVSMRFSKSVPAPCGEVEEDNIYFVNTGEIFNMRSNTCSQVRWNIAIPFGTWVFPPELVV